MDIDKTCLDGGGTTDVEEESEDGLCMRLVATDGQRDHRVRKPLHRDL